MFEDEYRLEFFKQKGFTRKICSSCGSAFWTLSDEQELCGDTPCSEFSFIGRPVTKKPYDMNGMRSLFLDYFKDRGHGLVEPYPVLARWRNDVLLVNASIYDFQPHVTSGDVPPPHNPLTISQPCIRMTDLEQVGRTGKHISCFEMMAHHVFNSPENRVYWKEETVDYCHDLLKNVLGISETDITYKEHPWIGGGNAGPSLEVIAGGLELATLVFMNMRLDSAGTICLDGKQYSPLPLNVVDTGYGLERMVWASQGTPTIYDAVFPGILQDIAEITGLNVDMDNHVTRSILEEHALLAGTVDVTSRGMAAARETVASRLNKKGIEVSPGDIKDILSVLETVYILTDHSKTIALLLSNGAVPSNTKAGYLLRLLIRRALRLMEERGIKEPLDTFVLKQLDYWKNIMDASTRDVVQEMMHLEEERYFSTVEKGRRMVKRHLEKKSITEEEMVDMYDSHGLHPSIVRDVGKEIGVDIQVPDNFDTLLASRHQEVEMKSQENVTFDLPATRKLYYEDHDAVSMDAVVIYSQGNEVVLDQTVFYPDGGGQPADHGVLETKKEAVPVLDVKSHGDVIVHILKHPLEKGTKVVGHIDIERRKGHTRHHTATHIMIGVCREVLGKHVWQSGSQNQASLARIDLSHFKPVTRDEIKKIELLANEKVWKAIPLEKEELPRGEAEEKYGFQLYQGGAPESKFIRVVNIPDLDTEACGGTHVHNTSEVGMIKVTGTERIQDGVVRITFKAGPSALEYFHSVEDVLFSASDVISVAPEQLPKAVQRFFDEWKERGKKVERLSKFEADAIASECEKRFTEGILSEKVPEGVDVLSLVKKLVEKPGRKVFVVSQGPGNKCVLARSRDVEFDCGSALRDVLKEFGSGGGGRPDFAQGGGVRDLDALVKRMRERMQ